MAWFLLALGLSIYWLANVFDRGNFDDGRWLTWKQRDNLHAHIVGALGLVFWVLFIASYFL